MVERRKIKGSTRELSVVMDKFCILFGVVVA
jgi:hypothetical protein